jgi:acyl-coenzyme A synthetase/AMP-(fatty) acid ligase/pimeloyl-ACP methyl ester carboxylesterase
VWHILDNQVERPTLTLLCVHGNPTWSFAFRRLIGSAPEGVRVIAVDQLDMGYSERTGVSRRLADRIEDLSRLTDVLGIDGPVVTVGHDWGGPISLGWALRHRSDLAGVVLTNTAVHQPENAAAPSLIRLVRLPGVLETVCRRTSAFIAGAVRATGDRHHAEVRRAYHAPYAGADRRAAIATFVRDIPLEESHPSHSALSQLASDVESALADIPVLLMWGPSDPVFSDIYLADLMERVPHAQVHRFVGSGHLVHEHSKAPAVIYEWLAQTASEGSDRPPTPAPGPSLWDRIDQRSGDDEVAVVELHDSVEQRMTFRELHADVSRIAAGLAAHGVRRGDRVALMVPPGLDLTATLYACWRIGAVVVIVDAGLGPRGITQAMRSARPDHLIGIPRAMRGAAALRWPGRRISSTRMSTGAQALLDIATDLPSLRRGGTEGRLPEPPGDEDLAAIAFTSGATGPAKGVAYRHHQARAQRDALMKLYGIQPSDRLVAAFAPFALYGPTMGITSAVPDMDVTAPSTLTARALVDAVASIDATLVFASPAALKNVAATASGLTEDDRRVLRGVRLLMSAGAPVHPTVLRRAVELMPNAEAHTPYGMTEALPIADISLDEIDAAGDGNGVCVGHPLEGVEVMIDSLDAAADPSGEPSTEADVTGEILIRAAHMRDGYDRLWATQAAASRPRGWHRTGDVGHLDEAGRLWVEGRLIHVISTANGPVTPVGVEHGAEHVASIHQAAVVGVGPAGAQQVVVVAVPEEPTPDSRSADLDLLDEVRGAVSVDVAAVLLTTALPVDVRHNSKIDRPRVAAWAEAVLAGRRVRQI